jgi:hypothetical protein
MHIGATIAIVSDAGRQALAHELRFVSQVGAASFWVVTTWPLRYRGKADEH